MSPTTTTKTADAPRTPRRRTSPARPASASVVARRVACAFALILLPSAVCLGLAGCNVFGILASRTVGPPAVKPQYVLPKAPVVVLVENFRNPAAVRLDAERLGRHITAELKRYDLAPIIEPAALGPVLARPDFASMKQSEIAKAVGAAQLIYVDLRKFDVEEALGSEMIRGHAELSVRVIDAATGETKWPTDAAGGSLLTIETPYLRTGAGTGPSGGGPSANEPALREGMAKQAAQKIARLFRKWKPDEEWVNGG